jgi:Fe-S cluster assembly protein SufD
LAQDIAMKDAMTLTTEKKRYLQHLDQFDKAPRAPAFRSLRQAARARLRDLDFPTSRTEDWRFTNVAPLLKMPFELARDTPIDARRALPPLPTTGAVRLVFVNGIYSPGLSNKGTRPEGLEIGSLESVRAEQSPRLDGVVGSADYKAQIFTALNTSFLHDGAYIVVAEGKAVEEPVEVIYLSAPAGKTIVSHPRTVVVVGKGSRVTVVERYIGEAGTGAEAGTYFTNAVTEIALGADAAVDHYKVQNENRDAYHVASTQVAQASGSQFTTHYLSLGGNLVRNEVRVRFDGEGSEATVNGLYLAAGKQHIDNYTVIDHAKPHCNSHELYKGILNDEAQGVFNGKIFVRPDAQKTDAKQTNKVLLLSDSATINTKPQLEIFADDVKCTHGATVGQLDAESIFYLRTRGVGVNEARALLTYAFANDIIGRIKVEALRDWLENIVMQR